MKIKDKIGRKTKKGPIRQPKLAVRIGPLIMNIIGEVNLNNKKPYPIAEAIEQSLLSVRIRFLYWILQIN
ncbi:hypothetical protein [Paenibacillus anseongensis]|nr:hypothetical protein [Paenibacillus sp. CGMCC 1.16610]